MTTSLVHPENYLNIQIRPTIRRNDRDAEIVWTYLLARKYNNDYSALVSKLLCDTAPESFPNDSKIWLEAYLQPTRQNERDSWKTRADLAIGYLEKIIRSENQIKSSGGDWVCIVESKWYDDVHSNTRYPEINQFAQTIEHALLLHDDQGKFPKKVYVTLVTPRYFKEKLGKFSDRNYWGIYNEYEKNPKKLKEALVPCSLPFMKHNLETLISRIDVLKLNWVTFEELLELPNLVEDHIPGKYRVTIDSWEEIFSKVRMDYEYNELSAGT
jgi:hypothetical protein